MLKKFDTAGSMCGIYAIYIEDKLVYIGQSINLSNRFHQHELGIRSGKGKAPWYLIAKQFYIRDFDFSFRVLEEVAESELLSKEKEYIKLYNPIFNDKENTERVQPLPKSYDEAINMLGLTPRETVKPQQIECRERAANGGWFGENYPNKDEFFWWEHE